MQTNHPVSEAVEASIFEAVCQARAQRDHDAALRLAMILEAVRRQN